VIQPIRHIPCGCKRNAKLSSTPLKNRFSSRPLRDWIKRAIGFVFCSPILLVQLPTIGLIPWVCSIISPTSRAIESH